MSELVWDAEDHEVGFPDGVLSTGASLQVFAHEAPLCVLWVLVRFVDCLVQRPPLVDLLVNPHRDLWVKEVVPGRILAGELCRRTGPGSASQKSNLVPPELRPEREKVRDEPIRPLHHFRPRHCAPIPDEGVRPALHLGGLKVCDAVAHHYNGLVRVPEPQVADDLWLPALPAGGLRPVKPREVAREARLVAHAEVHPVGVHVLGRQAQSLGDGEGHLAKAAANEVHGNPPVA
mmetsp:Transcript_4993/g.17521  ORF Transcript_4993/g.17521 Transcript_4993/m.17521 type:complete len:233 (-) Transcript_4993:511-1209(-)